MQRLRSFHLNPVNLSPSAIHTHLECVKPEWWNCEKSFPHPVCVVLGYISDCLGGRMTHQVPTLFPNGYIDIHNNLYFALIEISFRFFNGTKKNLALLCVGLKRKDESNYLIIFIENYPLGHRHLRFSFFNHNLKERTKTYQPI